jgi:hypothetical protein
VLAKEVRIFCGSRRLDWEILAYFLVLLKLRGVEQVLDFQAYKLTEARSFFNANPRHKVQGVPITRFFAWFGDCNCSDTHDKIYGLLDLSSDYMIFEFNTPLEEIAHDVLQYTIISTA